MPGVHDRKGVPDSASHPVPSSFVCRNTLIRHLPASQIGISLNSHPFLFMGSRPTFVYPAFVVSRQYSHGFRGYRNRIVT
jgi:hypothetical protein